MIGFHHINFVNVTDSGEAVSAGERDSRWLAVFIIVSGFGI